MTGVVAYVALGLWPLLTFVFFAIWPANRAAIVSILGGLLFLPEHAAFDAPLIPPLGKGEITMLSTLVGCAIMAPHRLRGRPRHWLDWVLVIAVGTAAFTVFGNPEPLFNGPVVRPGLTAHDTVSYLVREILGIGLPFLLGRCLIRDARDLETLLRTVVVFGIVYTFFILIELHMSPQFHRWIYGFHAQSFAQTIRWGGYRPVVFLGHGLALGVFVLTVTLAATVLWRVRRRLGGLSAGTWAVWFALLLVLCRSTGAIVLGCIAVPLVAFARLRRQAAIIGLTAAITLSYPIAKVVGLFPHDTIVAAAELISSDRAQSLGFRFHHDELLINRAQEKLWFGWGGYGRNRIFDEYGNDTSVTDGYWVILAGSRGILALMASFLLLTWPMFVARRAIRTAPDGLPLRLLTGLAMIVAVQVFDLLPNGLFLNLPYFYAGALLSAALPFARAAPAISGEAGTHVVA